MNNISMTQFNSEFQRKMKDVRILEKTHPKKAVPLWINVCELIISFAKSPNCPRDLRPKLIRQAEVIIAKVKLFQQGNLESVFNADLAKTQKPSSVSTSIPFSSSLPPSNPTINEDQSEGEEDMLATLQALPDIPIDSESASSDTNPTPSSGDIPFVPDTPPKPTDSVPPPSSTNLASLKDLEDQLKQMPSNFTEITPVPFTNASIISGIQSADPNLNLAEFKKDTTTLDITSSTVVSDTEPTINTADSKPPNFSNLGSSPDPFKASPAPSNSPDPFGPQSVEEVDKPDVDKHSCFACGASLPSGTLICPTCNTDNSEKPAN